MRQLLPLSDSAGFTEASVEITSDTAMPHMASENQRAARDAR